MKGVGIPYSATELRFLKARRVMPRRALHAAFVERFARTEVSLSNLNALCKRKGWLTGRTGCFPKGNEPHNKGKPHPAARNPNSARHWFAKGERRGVAVDLYKPIGTERLSKEGYRERKISDDPVAKRRWRAVHLVEWEAINGPIPRGMVLKCRGDKRNTDPSNWELIPRALLPRLNGKHGRDYDHAPAILKPAIMTIAKLEHAARTVRSPSPDLLP